MKIKNIIIGELLVLFIISTVLVITENTVYIDNLLYNGVMYLRSDIFDAFFTLITKVANTIPVLCITIICFLLMKRKEQKMLGITLITTVLSNQLLKYIIQRPRPDHVRLIEQSGYSYPSGHSMAAIALYGFLIYYVYKNVNNKYLKVLFMTLLSLLIFTIGISRIYVGVHYPSDVIGGFSLSLVIIIMVIDWCEKHSRGNQND